MELSRTSAEYWDAKYQATMYTHFDWYLGYTQMEPHLLRLFKRFDTALCEILIPGSGLSELPFHLYEAGFHNITNIDISAVAVARMQYRQVERFGETDDMQFAEMDAKHLTGVPPACFDVILDKGLVDTLFCHHRNVEDVIELLTEYHRVLKAGGLLVIVSHGAPDTRLGYLTRPTFDWAVACTQLSNVFPTATTMPSDLNWRKNSSMMLRATTASPPPGSRTYYMYVCTK
ncbi:Aste57867_11474 [Aphanomyces stellatus]|uniref:Aste57867_11474 protein n=1 Tax=Aphanomyces stellatus TaxID=120398 RepID=A0A485KTL7_9STRA|nr:hypothetical protein As57867_011431 [Aphanomyces stellatus]VFT88335.1 Aste57867_11474 [Aphanomyces stellatus]